MESSGGSGGVLKILAEIHRLQVDAAEKSGEISAELSGCNKHLLAIDRRMEIVSSQLQEHGSRIDSQAKDISSLATTCVAREKTCHDRFSRIYGRAESSWHDLRSLRDEARGRVKLWKQIAAVIAIASSLGVVAKAASCITAETTTALPPDAASQPVTYRR